MDKLPPEILHPIFEYATEEISYKDITNWNDHAIYEDDVKDRDERYYRSLDTKMVSSSNPPLVTKSQIISKCLVYRARV